MNFPFHHSLSAGTCFLGAHSYTQDATIAGHLALGGVVLLPVSFYCCFFPAQVLLEGIKCWTCYFEALRFARSKKLLAAASCLSHSVLGH